MIKVRRSPKPAVLVKNAAGWTRKLLAATTKEEKNKAAGKYQHEQIKAALVEMFHGKCAYCESKITHIDYGHIEHFKPKSNTAYRVLAFEWTNLVLACGVCNGAEHKGTKFPLAAEGGPFVNPCDDEPNDHFDFVYDPKAKLATVIGTTPRGATTEKLIGLNRHDLRQYRSELVKKLLCVKMHAQTDPYAAEIMQQAKLDSAEYAAFARNL
jgi:uncharacterized protein (TIGR02646 family)